MTRTRFDIPDASVLHARQQLVLDHIRDEVERLAPTLAGPAPRQGSGR